MEKQGGSLYLEGNFVYLGIVIVVNINVLTNTNAHTWISLFFQIGSIVLFLLGSIVLNYFKFSVLFGTIYPQYSSLEFYYVLIIMLLAIIQVDIGINYVNKKIREKMISIARKIKKTLKNMRNRKSTDSEYKPSTKRKFHRGFAFDQEPGNAPQVVNKIQRDSLKRTMTPLSNYSMLLGGQESETDYVNKTYYKPKKNKVGVMNDPNDNTHMKSVDVIFEQSQESMSKDSIL